MDKSNLGSRMKSYEAVTQSKLMRRTPVVVRVDGKAFHTFVKKHFDMYNDPSLIGGPYSMSLHNMMTSTATSMCQFSQNATFAYTQSDEISILFRDWDKHETQQWFDGKIQKICSVSSSMASSFFNFFFNLDLGDPFYIGEVALFDARVFNLPFEEVTNYFIWRQKDATRNSINMLGRHYYSAKELHGKNASQVQDMLMEKDMNWNNVATWEKRGTCIIPNPNTCDSSSAWKVDEEIPIFTKDREYIDKWLRVDNE